MRPAYQSAGAPAASPRAFWCPDDLGPLARRRAQDGALSSQHGPARERLRPASPAGLRGDNAATADGGHPWIHLGGATLIHVDQRRAEHGSGEASTEK